jgi:hypothetical protein
MKDSQSAMLDARLFGVGFQVDGKRVEPHRVTVHRRAEPDNQEHNIMTREFSGFERAMLRAVIWVNAISGVIGLGTIALRIIEWAVV